MYFGLTVKAADEWLILCCLVLMLKKKILNLVFLILVIQQAKSIDHPEQYLVTSKLSLIIFPFPPLHQFANCPDFQFVLLQLMFLIKIITFWSHQTSWILTSYQLQMVQKKTHKNIFNHHRFNGDFPHLMHVTHFSQAQQNLCLKLLTYANYRSSKTNLQQLSNYKIITN